MALQNLCSLLVIVIWASLITAKPYLKEQIHFTNSSCDTKKIVQNNNCIVSRRVLIWHSERANDKAKLEYMYAPMMNTLIEGFLTPPSPKIGVELVWGHDVSRLNKWLNEFLRPNDWFMYVGLLGSEHIPWEELNQRHIETILYHSEQNDVLPSHIVSKQVYTYTTLRPKQTYIPCGFIESSFGYETYYKKTNKINQKSILYLGAVNFPKMHHRMDTINKIEEDGLINITYVENAFSDQTFNAALDRFDIIINIHKYPGSNKRAAESVRFSQLLSYKPCLIISERSFPGDEKEFDGIVIFTSNLKQTILEHMNMPTELFRGKVLKAHSLFQERFTVRDIFDRAHVWSKFINNTNIKLQ